MQVRETQQTKVGLGENDMPVMVVSDIYFKMFASTWGKWSNLNSYFCRWDDHRRAIRIFRIGCIWIYWCVFIFSIDKNVINVDILIRRIFFEWIEVNMDMLFLQACFLLQREIPAPFKEEAFPTDTRSRTTCFAVEFGKGSAPKGTFQPNRKGWIVFQAPTIFSGVNSLLNFGGVFQPKNQNE